MLIAMASGKGAPGTTVTAAAMAAVWPRRPVLLVEADPRGGSLLYGMGQGAVTGGRGLLGLQLAGRRGGGLSAALLDHVVELEEFPQTWLVPGLDASAQAASMSWPELARFLAGLDEQYDVIVDCGAVPTSEMPQPIWESADLTVVTTRSTMASAHFAEDAGALLRADLQTTGLGVDRLVSVVVGPGRPYPEKDLVTFLQAVAPVIGTVAWDPAAAAVFSDGAPVSGVRRFRRSPLLRSVTELAERVGARAQELRAAQPAAVAEQPAAPVVTFSPTDTVVAPRPSPGQLSGQWGSLDRSLMQAAPVPMSSLNGHSKGSA